MVCQVIFFQGIPGLGKTTVALALKDLLEGRGKVVEEIDQDRFKGNRKRFAKALLLLLDDADNDYIIIHRNSANPGQYAWIAKECFARGFLTTMFYPSALYDPSEGMKNAILATCQKAVKSRGPHPTFDILDDAKKDDIVRKFYGLCEKPLAGGYFSYIHPIFYFYPDEVRGRAIRRPPYAIAIQMVGCLEKEKDFVPYPCIHLTTLKTYICIKLTQTQKEVLGAISDEYLPLSPIIKLYTDHITLIHVEDLVKAFDRHDGSYERMKALWDTYGSMEGETVSFKVSFIYTDKEDILVFGVDLALKVASRVPHITGRLYKKIPPVASASLIRDGTWKGIHYDLAKISLDLNEWEGTIAFQ